MSRITPPVTKLSHAMRSSLASTSRQLALRDSARNNALPELSAANNKHEVCLACFSNLQFHLITILSQYMIGIPFNPVQSHLP